MYLIELNDKALDSELEEFAKFGIPTGDRI